MWHFQVLLATLASAKKVSNDVINKLDGQVDSLRISTAIGTHHDAGEFSGNFWPYVFRNFWEISVSGTETKRTADSYQTELDQSLGQNEKALQVITAKLLNVTTTTSPDVRFIAVTNPLGWPRKQVKFPRILLMASHLEFRWKVVSDVKKVVSILIDHTGAVVSHGNDVVLSQVKFYLRFSQSWFITLNLVILWHLDTIVTFLTGHSGSFIQQRFRKISPLFPRWSPRFLIKYLQDSLQRWCHHTSDTERRTR